MSESVVPVGGLTAMVDPCPEDPALVLDVLVGLFSDAPTVLEPWRMTDKRLLAELEKAQLRATRAQAGWLALLAEAERREVTLRQLGLPTAGWLTDRNTHWARSARDEVRLAVRLDSQPRVIVHGLDRLPDDLDSEQREAVAAQLVEFGHEFGPYGLSRLVN